MPNYICIYQYIDTLWTLQVFDREIINEDHVNRKITLRVSSQRKYHYDVFKDIKRHDNESKQQF